jgi:uncharacterized integral membrane protein
MPSCPNCGAKVTEAMSFCPNCGTNLKPSPPPAEVAAAAPAPPPPRGRSEKQEKREKEEKHEKGEKTEKHEKQQYGPIVPIIGGVILIVLGLFFYLMMTMTIPIQFTWAYFLVIAGIAIILSVIIGILMASRRHPPT